MQSGHTDNFYYQLMANIRRYKGVHLPDVVSLKRTINLDDAFDQWASVTPDFADHAFDTQTRTSPGNHHAGPYIDTSGRNDLVLAKASTR
jgi:hypothetical protein